MDECKPLLEGDTALHDAARFGHAECVRLLLAAPGIKIGLKNSRGKACQMLPAMSYDKVRETTETVSNK